jgi:penicillin-binding protein 2
MASGSAGGQFSSGAGSSSGARSGGGGGGGGGGQGGGAGSRGSLGPGRVHAIRSGRMFQTRVALLAGFFAIGMGATLARMAYLTSAKGEAARAEAEARLIAQTWQPTVRGRILDRKGRVLAQDRPSFHIAVDYPVISGEWAFRQAARAARRSAGAERWRQLSPVQREQLVNSMVPEFQRRLENDWRTFARLAGLSETELDERRAQIVAEVSRAASTIWEQRRIEMEEELSRGRDLAGDVPLAEVARPIREQRSAHVILRNVDDPTAFRLLFSGTNSGTNAASATTTSGAAPEDDDVLRLPGLHVLDASTRDHPLDEAEVQLDRRSFPGPLASEQPLTLRVRGPLTPIVGWMREKVFAEDVARRPRLRDDGSVDRGFYRPEDSVGHTGVEASSEDALRGLRGVETRRRDTGETTFLDRQPGRDVRLTIDAQLQARIAALLSPEAGLAVVQSWQNNRFLPTGRALHAGCAVIEVETGDVLALVSTPGYAVADVRERPEMVFDDKVNMPALNRAIARPYAPGSIVKPLMFASAVSAGVWDVDRRVECTGHLFPDQPNMFRCWIYKQPPHITHAQQLGGPLSADRAICVSCNIFFYTVGRALGPERIGAWYARWGVGRDATHPKLGIGDQFSGSAGAMGASGTDLPDADLEEMGADPATARQRTGASVSLSEATLMGIGQGPVAWTPLHAADAYATLARGGVRVLPRLRADDPLLASDMRLDQRAVATALDGLHEAVTDERGTGHHMTIEMPQGPRRENIFTVPRVKVWGKSGTADSGQNARDNAGRPILDLMGRPVSVDHSWFVVLVGPDGAPVGANAPASAPRPKYAIAVLIENGGSGGRVAGPVVNQIIAQLVAEGYL